MTPTDHRVIFLLLSGFTLAGCMIYPEYMDDSNSFFLLFVGPPFLSVLGFVTAVTVASASSIHLHLNSLSDKTGKNFPATSARLLLSVTSMVVAFFIALFIIVIKSVLGGVGMVGSIFNGFSLMVIYFDLLVMLDMARTVFKIPPSSELTRD